MTPIELAAQAIAEGVAYRREDGSWMVEGGLTSDATFTAIARAVLAAIREPSEAMRDAGFEHSAGFYPAWQAMIDAALEER